MSKYNVNRIIMLWESCSCLNNFVVTGRKNTELNKPGANGHMHFLRRRHCK